MLGGVRVYTFNVNGLRSALRKGLLPWLEQHRPDVLLLQEVRADPMPEVFGALGYHSAWHPARKPGYSGVAVLARHPLEGVQTGFGDEALDDEGRLIVATVQGVQCASLYLPSGSSGEARQQFKDRSLGVLNTWTVAALQRGPLVLGGDFNVAHQRIDLHNWRGNQNSSGFLPHERAWMTDFLGLGLRDSHRDHLGETAAYTWWSNRGNAYANDVGWRIDYLLTSGVRLTNLWVDRAARLSDHAPLGGQLTPLA
ncbi:exodeoxyribonuclease III [Deinococcus sonorensis]|uniref:Exodeoxyribonuclease III n=2 Tax=Deinococcus sonorensis TaxID=309891 RepID=A0AAU7UAF0_9DEIO